MNAKSIPTEKPVVGQTVYVFDPNIRIYKTDAAGRSIGPIYAERWRATVITAVGRTIVTVGRSRFRPDGRGEYRSEEGRTRLVLTKREMEDDIYLELHRHRVTELVSRGDAALVRKVAELVGYVPENKD